MVHCTAMLHTRLRKAQVFAQPNCSSPVPLLSTAAVFFLFVFLVSVATRFVREAASILEKSKTAIVHGAFSASSSLASSTPALMSSSFIATIFSRIAMNFTLSSSPVASL